MFSSLLAFGFLAGVRHALEADHVAAVASLATRSRTPRQGVALAALWGSGHAAVLLLLGALLAALDATLPDPLARLFEGLAGLVLVALGLDVLRRARRRRVHFHVHRHEDGQRHLHAHAHAGEPAEGHDPENHRHAHPRGVFARALLVGSLHGLAGSGALLVLALQASRSTGHALAYMAVFGLGSILGMTLFSLAIALPLRLREGSLSGASRLLEGALGLASVAIGIWMAARAGLGV